MKKPKTKVVIVRNQKDLEKHFGKIHPIPAFALRIPPPQVRVRCSGLELILRDGPADLHAVEAKIKKVLKVTVIYDVPKGPAEEDMIPPLIGMAFTQALRKLCEKK